MSLWTHIYGIILIDYMSKTCFSSYSRRKDGRPNEYNPKEFNKKIKTCVKTNVPLPVGSEGPTKYKIISSERGFSLILEGSLRDKGIETKNELLNWLKNFNNNLNTIPELYIRNVCIVCEIDYSYKYFISFNNQISKFKVKIV